VIKVTIEFPGGWSEEVYATKLTPTTFKLEASLIANDFDGTPMQFRSFPDLGDTIKVAETEDKLCRFIRIVKRSRFRRHRFILNKELLNSAALERVKDEIMDLSGNWEQISRGYFKTWIPRGTKYHPWSKLVEYFVKERGDASE